MSFDLYGTPSRARAKATTTTLGTLAAAQWAELPNGRWQIMWDDHTDYGDEPGGGFFTCELYCEDGGWTYDYWHSERGEDEGNDLGADGTTVEIARVLLRGKLEDLIETWETSVANRLEQAARERDDE